MFTLVDAALFVLFLACCWAFVRWITGGRKDLVGSH